MSTIGDRVREAAKEVGGLNSLSKLIDMPRRTLGDQISGRYEVKLSFMVEVAKATGFSIEWLATGLGPKQPEKAKQAKLSVREDYFERLARIVLRIHQEAGIKLPAERLTAETAGLYNELLEKAEDMSDAGEVETILPQLEYTLKKRLQAATDSPGTGKREAS